MDPKTLEVLLAHLNPEARDRVEAIIEPEAWEIEQPIP